MNVAFADRFFALMTLAALAGVVGIGVLGVGQHFSPTVARWNRELKGVFGEWSYWLVFLIALVSMLGSLYYSEIVGYAACSLCWYQRIAMYPLALVIAIGMLRRDHALHTYVLPSAAIGIALSSYHNLLQQRIIKTSVACSSGVPCAAHYINWLGTPQRLFVTIPFLALTAFLIITFAVSAARRAPTAALVGEAGTRWRGVVAPIALAILIIAAITQAMVRQLMKRPK